MGNHIPFIKVKSSSWWPKTVTNKKSVVDETSSKPIHRFIGVEWGKTHWREKKYLKSWTGHFSWRTFQDLFFLREYDEMLWEHCSLLIYQISGKIFLQIHYRRVTRTALEASAQQPWMEFQPPKRDSWDSPIIRWPNPHECGPWPGLLTVWWAGWWGKDCLPWKESWEWTSASLNTI